MTHRCHGLSSTSSQQEEAESLHFSIPVSTEMQNDDWDTAVQVTRRLFLTVQELWPHEDSTNLWDDR